MAKKGPSGPQLDLGFRRPEGPLAWLAGGMFALWVGFAIGVNWLGFGDRAYAALLLDGDAFLHGEVWRLFTAPFVHGINGQAGVFHILFNLLVLVTFGRTLQREWGWKRLFVVIFTAALAGEVAQLVAERVLPGRAAMAIGGQLYFGCYGMSYAALAAFGFSHRDAPVSFFFFPTRGVNLVWIGLAFYVLVLIAAGRISEGVLAPFAAVGVGWLLGGGTPSPLRRFFLRRKLAALEKKTARPGPALRVIEGDRDRPIDKKWLN